ncbi:MAG TPA: ABC transporter permease subunit, partial [Pirellulales bacterium]
MIRVLVRKLLRDVGVGLALVALLLFAFECLWARVTQRITAQFLPFLALRLSISELEKMLFEGPGQLLQALVGGESIDITRAADMMSIGYVHPLVQTILCVWAVGRSSGAVAGELDRGTMELLLAQPVPRRNLILAHLCVDWLTIPVLCLSMWAG